MNVDFLYDGPGNADTTLLLGHGAGAPMDSPAMDAIARALSAEGLKVVRFEFDYMAARRKAVGRKPPPRAEKLKSEFERAIDALNGETFLVIGGKSMGGRVASMIADEQFERGTIGGLLCLGYPFHPPGQPHKLRTAHLVDLKTPTLVCQGTRDPFGTRVEVGEMTLSDAIQITWLEDGDHDLRPRKRVSGHSHADHLGAMAGAVVAWLGAIRFP